MAHREPIFDSDRIMLLNKTAEVTRIPVYMTCARFLAALLLITATTTPAHAQRGGQGPSLTPRIAFVSVQQLLDSVPGRNAVAADFADEVRLAETRVRLAVDSLQRAVETFSQRQQALTPTQREAATLTLRARELQVEDMVQRLNVSVVERRDAMQAPLTACVERAMRTVQKRDGWRAILDRDALGGLNVISASADVTLQVLDVLQRGSTESCLSK